MNFKTIWVLKDADGNLKFFNRESNVYSHIPNGTKARRMEIGVKRWKITSGKKSYELWNQLVEDASGLMTR